MWNLHGGTVIGVATSATLALVGGTLLHETTIRALGALFFGVMFLSSMLAVATIVRFFRNQRRYDMYTAIADARSEWHNACVRTESLCTLTSATP